ncbi:Bromodomain and WD repeat-containing [Gracilariopsis chorda]|uniref:Bromodomain and WD repeat-containing n=1 Tax=Gracilariopsis chorda TaxID=448386 RepID=A0A2V3IR93_9FLOR|nr:Bromodomain and WD repeat-containing [Gracilariopsis chorda]|eukprot:PXF44636.1 Bromodomain and WD repeat-containing [Gracilariopsis chorda]
MQSPSCLPHEDELLFLVLHHLHNYDNHPEIAAALCNLEHSLTSLHKLPSVPDALGHLVPLTYDQCAARYHHIPRSYLRDLVTTRLPRTPHPHPPATLFSTSRFAASLRKRSRSHRTPPRRLPHRSSSTNVLEALNCATSLSTHPTLQPLTLTILPKAYRPLKRLIGHHLPVFTTLFDHTARFIVTGSDDNLIKIWSAQTAYLQHTLRGHDSNLVELVMHPTKPYVISASSDTTLRVWDLNTGAALHVLDGGSKEVNAVQCSPCPDRPYLVAGGADGSVRLWDADHFEAGFIRIPIPTRASSRSAAHIPENARGAATSAAAPPSPLPASAQHPMADISAATLSALVASTPAPLTPLASAVADEALRTAPEPSRNGAAHSMVSSSPMYEVLSVCLNAGATRLAVSGTDCVAHVYAIDKPESDESPLPRVRLLTSLRGHSEFISQVLFSRNGSTIVTACRDGTARIWNRTTAKLPSARGRAASVEGMGVWSYKVLDCRSQIQADAPSMLSGGASGSACGSIVPRMRRAIFPVSVCAVLWSLDDRYVFTATTDAKIRVWHADTGKLARVLHAHEGDIYVLDCHPLNERILLSGGYDGRVILWDIETGAQLRSFSIAEQSFQEGSHMQPMPVKGSSIIDGQFSSDGLSFVVSDTSGATTLFGIDSGEATALAPEEQFFSNDCAPFRRDEQQRAVHESTGVLLHLVPKGRLCDKELRPHPPELQPNAPQPLVPANQGLGKTQQPSMTFKSVEYARDPNCEALLKRAQEFRENQEKEERRLLRDARNARRRMIMERERVALEKEDCLLYLTGDFEVPDSEFDDSDEDFDGDALTSDDSDSSSSYDDDDEDNDDGDDSDEIRPAPSKSKKPEGKTVGNVLDEPSQTRPRRELRKRRRFQRSAKNFADSGDSDELRREESPGYEIRTNESDSDHSEGHNERRAKGTDEQISKPDRTSAQEVPTRMRELEEDKNAPSNHDSNSLRAVIGPSSQDMRDAPRLGGAASQGKRRMRICSGNSASQIAATDPPVHPRKPHVVAAADSHPGTIDAVRSHVRGAQSIGSCYGRVNLTEAGGNIVSQAPLNPSFTSERIEVRRPTEGTFKPMEDHEGDSASCFRPHPVLPDVDARSRTSPREQMHNQSYIERSPGSDVKVDPLFGVNRPAPTSTKGDGPERSSLSDSPARIARCRWRARTRNGVKKEQTNDKLFHIIDIDEVAEKELQILEAQRNKRSRRKRRRRNSAEGDEENSSSEPDKRLKRSDPRRTSVLRMRPTRRNSKSEDVLLSRERAAGASINDVQGLEASTWLRSTSTPYTYVPQVGDDVTYFPGGHVTAMEVSRSSGLDPLLDKSNYKRNGLEVLDGTSFNKDQSPLRFQVVELHYDFPSLLSSKGRNLGSKKNGKRPLDEMKVKPKTKVILTLSLLSNIRRRSGQSNAFVLSYFPVDVPEYLVLTSRVDAALHRTWKPFDPFRILFLNEKRAWQYYTGRVRAVKPTVRTTMWNSIEVEYDNESGRDKENVDLVSPWELEPLDFLEGPKSTHSHHGGTLKASTVEPGLFPSIARELEAMKQVESNWRTQLLWLETANSLASVPGYCATIPCPMDLNTVLVRLCTGYYRHYNAFLYDVYLLKNNAIRYHGPKSEAGRLAETAISRVMEVAERVRAQYSLAWIPMYQSNLSPPSGANIGGQSACRLIRPRPANMEVSGVQPTPPTHSSTQPMARHLPMPITSRESMTGIAMATHLHTDSANPLVMPAHSYRAWNTMRFGASQVQPLYHHGHPLSGVGLPPAVPGASVNAGSVRSTGRGPKSGTRGQPSRQGTANGRRTNGNFHGGGQGSCASVIATAGTLHGNPGNSYVGAVFATPQVSPRLQPGSQRVTNSTQTNIAPRQHMRLNVPNGPLPSSAMARPGSTPPIRTPPALDSMLETASKGIATGNMASSLPDHITHHVGGGGTSHTNLRSPLGLQSRPARAGSTAGEGGTNSWARSMEGAGGMFHLQASTSDSHLPVPTHGRSQSPLSPTPVRADASHRTRGQHAPFSSANTGVRYQECSTLSVPAEESTMSCGGAEVARHAATAESVEVNPISHPRRTNS